MGPRAGLTSTLAIAGVTLLVAIAIGNAMGNHVLGQATERGPAIAATPVATPVPNGTGDPGSAFSWRREQVVSVATDPGFPDPRVTPEPPPPPPPARAVRTPKPRPSAAPTPSPTPSSGVPYTSPPLPIPLVTHATPGEASPESTASGTQTAAP